MKTLIKKEIRLLLPAWITAMLLAIVPRVFIVFCSEGYFYPDYSVPLSLFADLIVAPGLLFLGINSFGQELSSNTFSAMLSQPIKRPRLWRVKVATLAIAFISVWLTAILFATLEFGVYPLFFRQNARPALSDVYEFLTLSALVTFSGGLWTTLLLRQTAGAIWFTLLTPLAIILGISAIFQDWIAWGKSIEIFIVGALVIYSILGFGLARRLFMRAQDVQWAGGEISLPRRERISKSKVGSFSVRPGHRFSALAWKEFQLHQGAFLIAAILLLLQLMAWCIRKFHPHIEGPSLEFVFEAIWLLWLLMPLLIGAAAIAEERRMGTLEPQLCLPVSRRAQLFIKFCVALVLSLFLGAVVPVLIEGTKKLDHWSWIFVAAAAIFFVSFYASSLGRTTLQAIGLAFLFALFIYIHQLGSGLDFERPRMTYIVNPELGIELLKRYLGIPILLIAMGWLAFSNFKHVNQNWKFWTRNIITILAVFVCVPLLARGIYIRPWELVLPLEPRGPVRITTPNQVKFVANLDTISAILPDGRLWLGPILYSQVPKVSVPSLIPDSCHGRFIGGSNWVDVAADEFETVAVQSDGTLWAIPTDVSPFEAKTGLATMSKIGADDDWLHVASEQNGFLALKTDGSLWSWGTHSFDWDRRGKTALPKKISRDLASIPVRVSNETNWTELFSQRPLVYARNKNGDDWILAGNQMIQETDLDSQWSSLQFNDDLSYAEVKTNGTLWYINRESMAQEIAPRQGRFVRWAHPDKEQLGVAWQWKTAEFGPLNGIQSIVAIRSDGTLWQFPIMWTFTRNQMVEPMRIGNRSDWITLARGFALAADGSIWVWDPERSDHVWLAPSRRPIRLGNIFEEREAEIARSSSE